MTQVEALLSDEEYDENYLAQEEIDFRRAPNELQRPRHLELAPPAKRGLRLGRLPVGFAVVVSVMSLFGLVAANVVMAQQSFSLDETQNRHHDAVRLNAELRAEVAGLSSPARIVAEAEALGMVPAVGFQFVQGTKRATPTPATDEAAKTLRDTSSQARN